MLLAENFDVSRELLLNFPLECVALPFYQQILVSKETCEDLKILAERAITNILDFEFEQHLIKAVEKNIFNLSEAFRKNTHGLQYMVKSYPQIKFYKILRQAIATHVNDKLSNPESVKAEDDCKSFGFGNTPKWMTNEIKEEILIREKMLEKVCHDLRNAAVKKDYFEQCDLAVLINYLKHFF